MNSVRTLLDAVSALHLLRPHWLWALLVIPLGLWWWRRRWREASAWRGRVDPHLLPHLLAAGTDRRRVAGQVLAVVVYALAVLALAGPSWRQIPQPLWESRTPLVVALDLSGESLAGDLPPTRLAQAKAKLATLLQRRNGGPVGLIVYSGDAFTVAPITDDAANIALFLDALDPEVMPLDGQRPDRAIAHATQLLERTGSERGDIVLMTGRATASATDAASDAASHGYRVSVLGLGSAAGAAYPTAEGTLGHARLDEASLRALSVAGDGRYTPVTVDDADLRALGVLAPSLQGEATTTQRAGLAWKDEGYWLLPPLMLLALFAFRRRSGVAAVLVLCCWLPLAPARAQGLWQRPDQAAHAQLERGNSAYRRGEFEQAAAQYAPLTSPTAQYNRGNALAKAGRYREAIQAYDQVLQQGGATDDALKDDALANKRAVEAFLKRKPPPGGNNSKPQKGQKGTQQGTDATSSNEDTTPGQSPSDQGTKRQAQSTPAQPADANAQRRADRAQRERMQRELQQRRQRGQGKPQRTTQPETPQEREQRLANEAWLRRVPDDPGGLLRTKFRLEHERRQSEGRTP